VAKAEALVTSYGVYDFFVNGNKVGKGFMAPGWTSYPSRIQYQKYDITELLKEDGEFAISENETWINMVSKEFCDKIRINAAYAAA
jgi:alpha-L-rhamnosidase